MAKDSAGDCPGPRPPDVRFRQWASIAALGNEHMMQVGELLAGIVHEIRTLSVILSSANMMRLKLGPSDPNMQWVEPILRNAHSSSSGSNT